VLKKNLKLIQPVKQVKENKMYLIKKSFNLLALASILSFSLVTSPYAKEQPPVGSKPSNFQVPKTSTMQLDNGLKVTFIPYGTTPKATIRLITNTGNIDDGNQPWLADLSYEMLRQGTKTQSAKEIAENVASMGGQINSSVAMDSSWLGLDVLSEFSEDAIDVLADMILNPALAKSDLSRIKTDRTRQLTVQLSQPGNIASQAFYKAIYANHLYGELYPSEESLSSISGDNISQYLTKNIVAGRSHLYISGVFEQSSLLEKISKAFSTWPQGEAKKSMSVISQTGPKVIMLERENSPQSTIRLGLAAIAPDHQDTMAMNMMNTLLGGAFSSRITSNIREDKGYTYSPYSTIVNRINSGVWFQAADITLEYTGAALTEIFNEINLLAKTPPSTEELDGIKNYMAGIFVLRNSSRAAVINQLSFIELHQLSDNYLKDYVANVYNVTPERISEMASKYLRPEKMTLVVVGDKAQLTPQLKALEALKGFGNIGE